MASRLTASVSSWVRPSRSPAPTRLLFRCIARSAPPSPSSSALPPKRSRRRPRRPPRPPRSPLTLRLLPSNCLQAVLHKESGPDGSGSFCLTRGSRRGFSTAFWTVKNAGMQARGFPQVRMLASVEMLTAYEVHVRVLLQGVLQGLGNQAPLCLYQAICLRKPLCLRTGVRKRRVMV